MRYMLSIYGDEQRWADATPEQTRATLAGYEAFGREAGDRIVAGDGLQPTATATTVRVRDGDRLLSRRPVRRDQGTARRLLRTRVRRPRRGARLGREDPRRPHGAIEVRPVMDYEAVDAPADRVEEASRRA